MFDAFIELIAPYRCLGCRAEGSLWCQARRNAPPPAIERCYRCHQLSPAGGTCKPCRRTSSLYAIRAATRYGGQAKQLIWRLKFDRARAGGTVAAALLAQRLSL